MSVQGRSWIITHGISGGFLTYEMFKASGVLGCIDECHYTNDNAVVYTYLHFKSPVHYRAIEAFMDRMKTERQIIPFEIFGYDAISTAHSDAALVDHVGFKVLLDHYLTMNPLFQSCTDGRPGVVRGLIWKGDVSARIKEYLRARSKTFEAFFIDMEKRCIEYKQKSELVDVMRDELMENEAKIQTFRERIKRQHALINELKHAEFVAVVLKHRISSLDQSTREILLAPDHTGQPL